MALIRTVSNSDELREAVRDVSTIVQVHAGVAEHVVVLRCRLNDGQMAIISIRDEAFEEPSSQGPMVHAHDGGEFHDHSYEDYVKHPAMANEQLPPL